MFSVFNDSKAQDKVNILDIDMTNIVSIKMFAGEIREAKEVL